MIELHKPLPKRKLGSTGIEVSVLGLGTVKLGRNQAVKYPMQFELPTLSEARDLLDEAKLLGINLLDTAPAYGDSEGKLGVLLQGQRSEWVISTKVGEEFCDGHSSFDFSPNHIQFSIERSLKRLNTDYIDIVLVHSDGRDLEIIQHDRVFDILSRFKQQGKIRAFGMSTKSIHGGLLTVDCADLVMVTYNPSYVDERPVIATAENCGKGVLVKKALASGNGSFTSSDAIGFCLKEVGVSSVIVGTINLAHLRANALNVQ